MDVQTFVSRKLGVEKHIVLKAVMGFLANCQFERPYGWSLSRVDYALDIPGKIEDYYVLSRKMERFYETTRY